MHSCCFYELDLHAHQRVNTVTATSTIACIIKCLFVYDDVICSVVLRNNIHKHTHT